MLFLCLLTSCMQAEKMKKQESYEVECYTLFKNVDETILKLNPIIEKKGYEFIAFDFAELERNFSNLYSLPDNYQAGMLMKIGEGITISYEFYKAYLNHSLGGIGLTTNIKTFFLKRKENFHQIVIDNTIKLDDSMKIAGEIQRFNTELIKKLRLFKNGDIMSPVQFQISKESRRVESKLTGKIVKPPTWNTYSIADDEVDQLESHLNEKLETNDLTRLAEMYFENCYELFDVKARFTNLITALESIFNRSKDQISHVIARHLSLIISSDKEEFEINYKRIKKLYGYRSQIVHGQKLKFKENISEAIDELQDLTRKAIIYCMKLEMDKDDFFAYLNAKGF